MHKVFCLLSGGVDSTTALAIARSDFPGDPIETVTIDYGQRHKREIQSAMIQAEAFDANHRIISVGSLLTGMLVDKGCLSSLRDSFFGYRVRVCFCRA